jgi:3-oxoacyl-(acyl-carrier-protein) synthase/NAD(P)-dependent dehydrogenase (short-subunit alcohol dehydrogenase family)
LGLPGTEHIFDDTNIARILRGEQFIDVIPTRFRRAMLDKNVTRLVKGGNGGPTFAAIDNLSDVIKLAARGNAFNLESEFGVSAERIAALDRTSQLAIAVGIDALRDAGIPLVMRYKTTSKGTQLPDHWGLPDSLRDDTGVIFASAFPGYDSFADEMSCYYANHTRQEQLSMLESLRARAVEISGSSTLLQELDRRIKELRVTLEKEPYGFDRRFLFRALSMGHSQFAEFIGARGPNTQINSACASTAQAVSLAEDWIRAGRCRRVIVISADDVTSDHMLEWIGAGFLATGAAATDEVVEDAAIPFDRRRHGMIIGMGAAALVIESADAVNERGIRPICEVLSTVTANSAFHGTRLDIQHIGQVMEKVIAQAERRGISRHQIAPKTVFLSHETYTPARGGSASAEVYALRHVFGDAANQIVIANTKGFTGHAMATGIEDVVAIKALETGCVPPVANFKEVDPELGQLNLSKGGIYPVEYALHLGAGFGSQISMILLHWVPIESQVRPSPNSLGYAYRISDTNVWKSWLTGMAGHPVTDLEVVHRTLRVPDRVAARVEPEQQGRTLQSPSPVRETMPATSTHPMPLAEKTPAPSGPAYEPVPPKVESPVPILVPAAQPSGLQSDAVKERILALVVEKTGYPQEMLDLDLDLEADLGIDTVKQAEMFAAIREIYSIPRDENRKLRDYPTLAHVIRFVYDKRPDLVGTVTSGPVEKTIEQVEAATPAASGQITSTDSVRERVLALVVEKTGYPKDMLDLELDLEADLGVDTVKQAEMFAAIREIYNIPRDENRKLRDYPTLAHVIRFIYEKRPDLAASTAPETVRRRLEVVQAEGASARSVASAPTASAAPVASDEEIKDKVLDIVVEKTGYPKDMLDLELDLEADLGIDTVKQAEMFASVRAMFNIPRDAELKLRDFPTLAHVIGFARDRRPTTASAVSPAQQTPSLVRDAVIEQPSSSATHPRPTLASFDAANRIPRRVPVPTLRPPLALCKSTGVTLGRGNRVVLMSDKGGVGDALSQLLRSLGVEVLLIEGNPTAEVLADRLKGWVTSGPIHGVYWLPALDYEGKLREMDVVAWREAVRVRVKLLYAAMRILYEQIAATGTFLVSATLLGGQHGYDDAGARAPLGGAVTGFAKAYKRERADALVKAVDFESGRNPDEVAKLLIDETLRDPGAVEVGYKGAERWTVALQERPATDGQPGLILNKDTVFLITGAAGSIVSAITADLAAASGGTFYLLDLVPEPDPNNPDLKRFVSDKEALKRELFARIQARGERATPVLVEREIAALERANAAQSAIDAVRAAGGEAHYFTVNLTDADAVSKVIKDVCSRSGCIDVLLHAAGIERSHFLPDKDPREFDLVFDVKSDGWFNLLRAIGDMPLGATVAFSSIAGRFGNGGQTDYSAANDLLCKITSNFRTTRSATRGIVIDWTAWDGIGMATRGSIPKMMEVAGIDMLPPEAGIPLIRRELTAGGTRGEIVVGQRLGALLNEWDVEGGLDNSLPETSGERHSPPLGPMIGNVVSMRLDRGLVVETMLDPKQQPFLHDHQIEGTPVLPGVMGIEGFAEAAQCLAPGWRVESFEDVNFLAPFKFYRHEPRRLTVEAIIRSEHGRLIAECRLTGSRTLPNQTEPQTTVHFTGRVRLTREPSTSATSPLLGGLTGTVVKASEIYRAYFHGPAYQVIEKAWWDGYRVVCLLADHLPQNHCPDDRAAILAPRLIELCFQTAGLWEMGVKGRMGLPFHIRKLNILRTSDLATDRMYAVVTPCPDHESFDADVVDTKGNRYLQLSAYSTIASPNAVDIKALKALQEAMSLQAIAV